jgi:hypothetical protein
MKTQAHTAIRLRLRDLAQLFNSMDPSPFIDRDLDADAEEYIVSWARELPSNPGLELVIELAHPTRSDRTTGVEDAVRRYFSTRASIKQLEFGHLMRRGRLSLIVGTIFLTTCLLLGELVTRQRHGPVAEIITEGLTIAGWVALWRPLEIYLYDWWPLLEEHRRLDRLAKIRVKIEMPELPPVPEHGEFVHEDFRKRAA